MGRMIVNVKLERLCEEAIVAYFKTSNKLPEYGTKNYEHFSWDSRSSGWNSKPSSQHTKQECSQ